MTTGDERLGRRWSVEHLAGSASAFHGRPVPGHRSVWWFTVERPALVLGSTQPDDVVDHAAAAEAGVDVVRRHSGGGAVLLVPGHVTWVDVVLPAGDPLWDDDVARAFDWLGAGWVAALRAAGIGPVTAHAGRLVRDRWSDLVCFGGLGRGEVAIEDQRGRRRKILGISQRRTRQAARFQCALLHHWDPAGLVSLLALTPDDRRQAVEHLATRAIGVPAPDGGAVAQGLLVDSLVAELPV